MLLSPSETHDVNEVTPGVVAVRKYIVARLRAHLWTRGDTHAVRIPERLCRGTGDSAWAELVRECRDDGWQCHAVVSGSCSQSLDSVTLYFTKN